MYLRHRGSPLDTIDQLTSALAGRYQIDREIGRGGMATVYLARDVRHQRNVALKVLDPELGAVLGGERFLSEIRVTATLQHPNLLALFDSGEADGLLFYVMPYIEGETLRQRIDRETQLPVDEAVRLATSVAGALDYAHRHGVVHRDLKPENVLLHDGQPVVADFGIALAISNAAGARVTQTGHSLGTPQYMSPEQAAGDRQIDARTDIYSLGAVTYEMLTGEPPHSATTARAVIAKLMTEEPRAISTVRRSVPPHVDAAVHRALEKVPGDRFDTAREFADALNGKTIVPFSRARLAASSATRWKIAAAASTIVGVAALAWAMVRGPARATPAQHIQFALLLPDSAALDATDVYNRSFDLSPDGTQFAYLGPGGLFVRRFDELTPRRLTSGSARRPRFSPDGAWVGYVSTNLATPGAPIGTLRKIPASGGTPVTIVDSVVIFAWSRNGTILFSRSAFLPDLWRIADAGGPAERIVRQARPTDYAYGDASFFPDGDAFVLTAVSDPWGTRELAAGRLSDGKMRYLGLPGGNPRYLPDGILLFLNSDDGMSAVSFDARTLRITGTPTTVLPRVMTKLSSAELAMSETGTLAYLPGNVARQLVELDRAGHERVLTDSSGLYAEPRYSPDGRRVALLIGQVPVNDVWIYDISSSTMDRLTSNRKARRPEWTPDGRRVAWTQLGIATGQLGTMTGTTGVYWRAADVSDAETPLLAAGSGVAFSRKGDYFVTTVADGSGRSIVSAVRLDSTRRQTPIMESNGRSAARVSPDGRWLAYISVESGRPQLYVRAISGQGGHYQISASGASEPAWNPRGEELFYRVGSRLLAAKLAFAPEPRVVRRDTLAFAINSPPSTDAASYDVSADGQRFLMVKPVGANSPPIIITGWLDEVRAKVKSPK